jgi:hypothetical protein
VDYDRPELTPTRGHGVPGTLQRDVNGCLTPSKRRGNLRGASSAAVQSAGVPNNDVAEP